MRISIPNLTRFVRSRHSGCHGAARYCTIFTVHYSLQAMHCTLFTAWYTLETLSPPSSRDSSNALHHSYTETMPFIGKRVWR